MPSKSSRRWLKEHFSDAYVKKAKQVGYRSRAVFKLLELQKRDHLFKPGMIVIDLGATPGGWSQVVAPLVKPNGKIIAIDILPMEPIQGVEFIQGDFTNEFVLKDLLYRLSTMKVDWIISDMAPNISGNESVDIPQIIALAEMVLDFSRQVLGQTGGCLMKVFQGEGFDLLLAEVKRHFTTVIIRKPKASRSRSREVYILAKQLKVGR